MSKSNPRADKTEAFAKSRLNRALLGSLFMLGVLTIANERVTPQQTQPIQPCVVKKPCTSEPASANKQNSPSRQRSSRKRAPAGKRTSAAGPAKVPVRVSEILIDANIPADPALEKMLEPYSAKVRVLEVVIGKLDGELKKESVGAGNLGNFVADGLRVQSSARLGKPVTLAVTNSGGLRKNTIAAGDLRAADIFELLPFENALIEIDLTGEQLLKLLAIVTKAGDAQSGARITYRTNADNRREVVSAVRIDKDGREIPIDSKATYTIVTIDYLLKLASGSYSILQDGKNVHPLGVTMRDAIMDYVKNETGAGRSIRAEIDGRFTSVDATGPESKPE